MENRRRRRPSSLRHNQASEVVVGEERFCSNLSRVIDAGNGQSTKAGGSSVPTIKDVGFMS